jgi:Arc/MetJ-type ribon-helix-helix transcriptional regulator
MDMNTEVGMKTVGARVPAELDAKMDKWVDKSPSMNKSDLILLAVCRFLEINQEQQDEWMKEKKRGGR